MPHTDSPCQTCGACCSYSKEWPRFTTESDEEIDLLPRAMVDDEAGGMLCSGDRCAALQGTVGVSTSCSVYEDRPVVCRACEPGDEACSLARASFGLPVIAAHSNQKCA